MAIFVGKELGHAPAPAAVVDRAVVRRNCLQMLKACDALGVMFRPHIKTHKVTDSSPLLHTSRAHSSDVQSEKMKIEVRAL